MQQNAQPVVLSSRVGPQRADKKRQQDVQKVIKGLEEEMQRLVDLLVKQTNH